MGMPEEIVTGLGDLLQDSVARITPVDGSKPAGAAFFVSETILVTNRHVVGKHDPDQVLRVRVHPYGGEPQVGTVLDPSASDPNLDVALVRLDSTPGRPAVVLHKALDRGSYILAGYPREDFYTDLKPGVEVTNPVEGQPRNDNKTKRPQLLRLTGVQIKPGYSGGPVLSATTGAVVGVAVYSENPDDDLGGGALPVDRLLDAFPELARLAGHPPRDATRRYRELLGRPRWEALGLVWNEDEQVDIYLTGDRSCWQIGIRPDDAPSRRTIRDLGDDMSEVLVRWARSSGRRDESEVRLMGRLLSAAMFPTEVTERLPSRADRTSDPVLVRLHVDPSGPLADLPWEFATDPSNASRFLAATEGYAFVRVNPDARVPTAPIDVQSIDDHVRVLTIVVQPDNTTRWPAVVDLRELIPWPQSSEISDKLSSHIHEHVNVDGSPVFLLDQLRNPTLFDLRLQEQKGTFDIVHYVGFGYQEPDQMTGSGLDRSWIACWGGTGGADDLRYQKARDVMEAVANLQPKLAIFEFGSPSVDRPYELVGRDYQPVGPALLDASNILGVHALICTRAMHPIQYDRFNRVLYSMLAAGQTIEHSVQLARQAVLTDPPVDFAGFGWFVVTTGNSPRSRFFARASRIGERAPKSPESPNPTTPRAPLVQRTSTDAHNASS